MLSGRSVQATSSSSPRRSLSIRKTLPPWEPELRDILRKLSPAMLRRFESLRSGRLDSQPLRRLHMDIPKPTRLGNHKQLQQCSVLSPLLRSRNSLVLLRHSHPSQQTDLDLRPLTICNRSNRHLMLRSMGLARRTQHHSTLTVSTIELVVQSSERPTTRQLQMSAMTIRRRSWPLSVHWTESLSPTSTL